MIYYILITLLVPLSAGIGIMFCGLMRAPLGCETPFGFHRDFAESGPGMPLSYVGAERRTSVRRAAPAVPIVIRRYSGPLRRRSDNRALPHFEVSQSGGAA